MGVFDSVIREMGEYAVYIGAIPDDPKVLTSILMDKMRSDQFDVIITTGGVTAAKYCSVAAAISNMGG